MSCEAFSFQFSLIIVKMKCLPLNFFLILFFMQRIFQIIAKSSTSLWLDDSLFTSLAQCAKVPHDFSGWSRVKSLESFVQSCKMLLIFSIFSSFSPTCRRCGRIALTIRSSFGYITGLWVFKESGSFLYLTFLNMCKTNCGRADCVWKRLEGN